MLEWLEITQRADVAAARQQSRAEALGAGLPEARAEDIAIVATELCTNMIKYADGGRFLAQVMPQPAGVSVALIATDQGPGIPDPTAMRQDHVSGGQGAGIGIGAIERLSSSAEMATGPAGTIWACRFDGDTTCPHGLDIAGLRLAYPNESVCGDAWGTVTHRSGLRLALVDGMGHGAKAADAGQTMIDMALARPAGTPKARIQQMVHDLQRSRGGVVSILDLAPDAQRVTYGNLGNISGLRLFAGEEKRLVTRDGFIGSPNGRPMEEEHAFQAGDLLILHSDGLRSIDSDQLDQLCNYSALMVAAQLLARQDLRRKDDIGIAVARWPAAH